MLGIVLYGLQNIIIALLGGEEIPAFVISAPYGFVIALSLFTLCRLVAKFEFLSTFELSILCVTATLCLFGIFNSVISNKVPLTDFSSSNSLYFVQVAFLCVGGGCYSCWAIYEVFQPSLVSIVGDSVSKNQWIIKLAILSIIVAFVIPIVDALSMVNWMICFVFYSNKGLVVRICCFWAVLITLAIVVSNYINGMKVLRRTNLRKIFHLLALLLFAPIILIKEMHSFLCLSTGLVLSLCVLLEFLRVYVFGEQFKNSLLSKVDYFTSFAHKSELLQRHGVVLSHLSLLCGCSYPIFLCVALHRSVKVNDVREFALSLLPYLGIVSVCVGDSLASICGSVWGVARWRQSNSRTILGSFAAFVGMLISCGLILGLEYKINFSNKVVLSGEDLCIISVIAVTTCLFASLVEAFASENDNILLPFCSSCCYMLCIYVFL